jgi:hypothetical protein
MNGVKKELDPKPITIIDVGDRVQVQTYSFAWGD